MDVNESLPLFQLGLRELALLGHRTPVVASVVEGAVDSLLLATELQHPDDVIGCAEALVAPLLHERDDCLLLLRRQEGCAPTPGISR